MKRIVVPCSGIGKGFGTVSREVTRLLTEELAPEKYRTICLPLMVADDEDTLSLVRASEVIAVDGCPKKCATVAAQHAGATLKMEILLPKVLAANQEHKPGSVLDIGEGGKALALDAARLILEQGGE